MNDNAPPVPTVDEIIVAVFSAYPYLSFADMRSRSHARRFARPRQIAMRLARELTPLSTTAIGKVFGGRDHTTVLHAQRRIGALCAQDRAFEREVENIRERIFALMFENGERRPKFAVGQELNACRAVAQFLREMENLRRLREARWVDQSRRRAA